MNMQKETKNKDIKWKEANDCPNVYANFMAFSLTPFDITIHFGRTDAISADAAMINPQVRVCLAPEQAANLQKMLGVALKAFVEGNGDLRTTGQLDVDMMTEQMKGKLVKIIS